MIGLADPPPHVSAYALTVEPGTPLAADPARHPDDDVQAGRYERAEPCSTGPATGGRRSPTGPDPGTSAGTTASTGSRATTGASARPPTRTGPAGGGGTSGPPTGTWPRGQRAVRRIAGEEVLTDEQRRFEALALALRTPAGVPADALPDDPDLDGLVERADGRAVLTVRGRLLANAVTARLQVGTGGAAAGPGRGTDTSRYHSPLCLTRKPPPTRPLPPTRRPT